MSGELYAAAMRHASAGRPVLPLHTPDADGRCSCRKADCESVGKHPRLRRGLTDASTDPATIQKWWEMWPSANVAVRTGACSRVVVLDVDGEEGFDTLRELEREHGALPSTPSVKTPRGGEHFYFAHPGGEIPSRAGVPGPKVDVRGDGGYTLVPPSLGANGRRYEPDHSGKLAPLPTWLLERVTASASPTATGQRQATPAAEWLAIVREGVEEGRRNAQLTRLVGHLLRRYVDVDLTAEIARLVNAHRFRPPLAAVEVDRILNSVAEREHARRAREGRT